MDFLESIQDENQNQINNQYEIIINSKKKMLYIPFEELRRIYKPQTPFIQRDCILERVEKFAIILNNYYEEYNLVHDLNTIHIGKLDNKYYLIDGQHRYRAYAQFWVETNINFNVLVMIYETDSNEEFRQIFRELNDNYITNELILEESEIDKKETIKKYILEKYPKYISKAENPRSPNIRSDSLIFDLINKFQNKTSKEIIESFEEMNKKMGEYIRENDNDYYIKVIEKNTNNNNLFYGYIFHQKNECVLNKDPRKKIPQSARNTLFESKFGNELNKGKCFVCKRDIVKDNFHCGHKISVKNGGTDQISNLECICVSCNLSMGSMNMDEYINRYF